MASTENYIGSPSYGFPGLPDNTVYSNPCKFEMKGFHAANVDKENLNKHYSTELKALESTSGGAGTAGYAMVPVFVDPRVTDVTRKFTPLVEIIPRVTNQGRTAEYNKITAKGGATTLTEDSAITETDTTYDRASTEIKYIYTKGRVTGQAIATIPPYTIQGMQPAGGAVGTFTDQSAGNAKQLEILVKTREIREKEEDLIVNGNATTSASTQGATGANGTEYDGIITLMTTTNTVDRNTAALTWANLELAIRYAFDDGGRPTVAVASSDVVTDIRKLMIDTFRINPSDVAGGSLGFGIPTAITIYTMVGPVTVIPSMFMSNTSGSKAIYFLDMSVVEMRVLQDLTYWELAITADAEPFALKIYEALIIKNTAFCSSVTEISG